MRYRGSQAELETKRRRLGQLTRMEPELTPSQLGHRLGLSHVTVRRWLRELGLYRPRGVARERMEASP